MKPITFATWTNSGPHERKPFAESTLDDCRLIEFERISNRAGTISVAQCPASCPFPIARVYYLYDIPCGAERGGHAHRELEQLIIAVTGSFDTVIDDGIRRVTVSLNRPHIGLYLPPGMWRELSNFSSASVSLVLASHVYAEADYVRDYEVFRNVKRAPSTARR